MKDDTFPTESDIYFGKLYKYREFPKDKQHLDYKKEYSRIEEIFLQNKIYFSSPLKFNDPFDCKSFVNTGKVKDDGIKWLTEEYKRQNPDLSKARIKSDVDFMAENEMTLPEFEKVFDKSLSNYGVLCLSEIKDDILMWSHYGNSHTGFCIEFNNEKIDSIFCEALQVNYEKKFPMFNIYSSSPQEKFKKLLLTKAIKWKYEKERRIIYPENGYKKFPPEIITGVIFGCQMEATERDELIKILRKRDLKPVLYEARKKEDQFGLDIFEVNY
jgi:hypothetical protein